MLFGGMSFLVSGCVLLFLSIVLFFMSDKTEPIEEGRLPPMVDWSLLLLLLSVFCLLSEHYTFIAVFLFMTIITGITYIIYHVYRKPQKAVIETLSIWHVIDYFKGFFWIFAILFVIRAFVVDLSIIPSSSMRPGLVVGDFVLVNKFVYGIKLPISNKTLLKNKSVDRGDVVVFDFPLNRSIQYVKRVIGIPGDIVEFSNKNLIINGEKMNKQLLGETQYFENSYNIPDYSEVQVQEFRQNIKGKEFNIYEIADRPTLLVGHVKSEHPCTAKNNNEMVCKVPEGKYFVLGDNRDNSEDGRYWGFVDERDIQGKAFFIWMNLKELERIGTQVK